MSVNDAAFDIGSGGAGLSSGEEKEEQESSDSSENDNIIETPAGTRFNTETREVLGEGSQPVDSSSNDGSSSESSDDRPEPGDPDWPQADVKPEGALSIVTNVAPGQSLSPRIQVRGDGPAGESTETTYRVEVPSAGLSKSMTVEILGGRSRPVHLEGLGSIDESGAYDAILYGNGKRLDTQTYQVGSSGAHVNTTTSFEETQEQSNSSSDTTSSDQEGPSTTSTGSTTDTQNGSSSPDQETGSTGEGSGGSGGSGAPPAAPETGGSSFPGASVLGDTEQLLVGLLALAAVVMMVRR